jgi:hypothetical protein
VTAVRAEHSSIYVWRNPATGKDETHPGGEAMGWIIELENGFRIYHAGRHGGVRRHEVHRRALQARPGAGAHRRQLHDGPGRRGLGGEGVAQAQGRDPDALRQQPAGHAARPRSSSAAMGAGSAVKVLVAVPGQPLNF